MVTVMFFASLRERVGLERVAVEANSVAQLFDALEDQLSAEALESLTDENVRIAVNQTLIEGEVALVSGDEVAFLPPVTGG